jgi:hypothetical protein
MSSIKKTISPVDLLTLDFWRYFGKAVLLFFPSILFLVFTYVAFWNMLAAQDMIVMSLERTNIAVYCLVALVFWAYVTWYSSRLVAKARQFQHPDDHPVWNVLLTQGPRILAFSCFTIVILALLQLPYLSFKINRTACNILLLLSFSYYFLLYHLGERLIQKPLADKTTQIKFLQKVRTRIYVTVLLITVIVIATQHFIALIFMLLCWQAGIIWVLLIRRKIIEANENLPDPQHSANYNSLQPHSPVYKKVIHLVFRTEEQVYFQGFNVIALFAALVYFATIFSVSFSVKVGPLPFVLLAFGVLAGLGNAVAFLSILARFNLHVLFIALAVLIGHYIEPHYAGLTEKQNTSASFKNRQHLGEFFKNWIEYPERKKILDDTTVKEYPVYFVLANGGGARSAYWVSAVLSKFEDETKGAFSKHLFSLSGASGGSWGNAVFFNIIRNKEKLPGTDSSITPCQDAAARYLQSDFLTYTLARLLGPDIFRHIFPLKRAYDRGAALSDAMERASGKTSFMYNHFSAGFSSFITQQGQKIYNLPVLCINATRMQDGAPGVISNIDVNDTFFNRRLEVLNMVDDDKDLKLSTAIVLGGSSPYINPAGRIDEKLVDPKTGNEKTHPHYFVDGGYFDNSGAGVVNEMIIELRRMLNADSSLLPYKNKLGFYVLHITNDPIDGVDPKAVSPLVNDLASPVKTLMGSYETQTYVNDSRLKNYMKSIYGNHNHYINFDLYRKGDKMRYPVNWAISQHVVDSINKRISTYEKLPEFVQQIKAVLK